ncbi:hypothetical protein EUX98_g5446 [Antrodiella citrinella]|uniref:AB hydrolase-1 domain-containing protein n=1 Tax=Antrodiella citrinella TaxID=2447956 RepID=A0A4S4MZA7_9APHY|nr:hypothetical protein EUX98_g5446 [Antrodiella citrinella]
MASVHPEVLFYHHGEFSMAGGTLPDAISITAYRTYGDSKNPAIVFPTCYTGRLDNFGCIGQDYMIGKNKVLDPSKYYIVTFGLFSNGESSSPSNTPAPYDGPYFPLVTYEDNIRAQHAVLTKKLGLKKVYAVIGFSMGAQQAYYWAAMYPDFIDKFIPLCGTARTPDHSKAMISGLKSVMNNSVDFHGGHYTRQATQGIRSYCRVFSTWTYSQEFYRKKLYLFGGKYNDVEDFLKGDWEAGYLSAWDANDLIVLLETWNLGDISKLNIHSTKDSSLRTQNEKVGNGNLEEALSKIIRPKGLVMPGSKDLFFTPEDNAEEVSHLKNAKMVVIESDWGHQCGAGLNEADHAFIKKEVHKFLEEK